MSNDDKEMKLTGGNVSHVYRRGNTIRRELKPESARIHKLLEHLAKNGFHYAPEFLGIDEKGREILTFIAGEAGNYPLKKYMRSDEALQGIAKMLRLYHETVSDFPFDEIWHPVDNTPAPYEILCHNDFAIYNIIFKDNKPVGIIDFDVAGPGPKLWDIAYTLYTCVPLSRFYLSEIDGTEIHYHSARDAERIKQRIALFFNAYGMKIESDYLEMVLRRVEGLCQTITRKAEAGDTAFQQMLVDGHLEHYQKDIEFIRNHGNEWT